MRGKNTAAESPAKKEEEAHPPPAKTSAANTGGNDEALQREIEQLRNKIRELEDDIKTNDGKTDELQEEIKRQAKIINKEIKKK
jgi:predicted RNase H-like nuclease (RuvC/YqgF family)